MKEKCSKKTEFLKIFIFIFTFVTSAAEDSDRCISNFTLHEINTPHESKTVCASLFQNKVSWDAADVHCKLSFSYLSHRIYKNSSLYSELVDKGIDLLWLGIRRRANFFIAKSSTLFEEIEDSWGYFWSSGEPRRGDCAALNVTSGSLLTRNCKSPLPFVCENSANSTSYEESIAQLTCPENWKLLLPLSSFHQAGMFSGRKCVSRLNEALSEIDAERLCKKSQSGLATSREYDVLHSSNYISASKENTAYWVNREKYQSCVFKILTNLKRNLTNEKPENCSKPLQFFCVKDLELEYVDVRIQKGSQPLDRYTVQLNSGSSSCLTEDMLTCYTNITDKIHPDRLFYQWYKDDIPISDCHSELCKVSFVNAAVKWARYHHIQVNVQGSYHCEVRVAGLSKSYRSNSIDVFYPDIASYVINIHGIDLNSFIDYSHRRFEKSMKDLNETVINLLNDLQCQDAAWDFQSISVLGNSATMKILIYLNRTSIWDFHNVRYYNKMKKIFQTNSTIFPFKGNISSTIYSADVCFMSETESNDSCYGNISWPTSQQATDSSSAMCLDEHNEPVMRKCKGSFTNKAEWSVFNCTMCKEFYKRDSDLRFQCSDGFSKFKQRNLCFKIYNEEKNWYDAYGTCSEISSYMMNDIYEEFGSRGNFWLSYKYNYGKIQSFGIKPVYKKLENVIIKNPELHCVSAVLKKNDYKLQLENCSKEMQFVCIQNPYELISSVKFANTWTKFHHQDSCYYFDKSPQYNWEESISTCNRTFRGASLLHGVQDIEVYKFLKWLIYQKYDENTCYSFSWWMNFTYANYVDWSPDVNFKKIKNGHRSITLYPGKKIYWTLAEADSKLRLLCEMQKCEDNRPTLAYIEDRSKQETILSSRNYINYVKNFKLKCIPSGWFVTNSICWYKDGILLDVFDEYFDFSSVISGISQITPKEALKYQGYYSCSVDQLSPIKTIYSSEYLFKIPGYHTVSLSFVSQNKTYLNECGRFMMNEKLDKSSLENCLNNNLVDIVESFHFLLKNVTCNSTHLHITMHMHFEEEMDKEDAILTKNQNFDFYKFCEVCDIEHVSSQSTGKCYKETMMLKDGNITWPTTVIGMTAYPEEIRLTEKGALLQRKCVGDFNSGALWSEVSVDPVKTVTNIQSNITRSLYLLQNEIKEYGNGSLQILPQLTSSPEELQAADVSLIAQIFENLANQESLTTENLNNVVQTISNLIDAPPEAFKETADSSNQIVEYFEKITSIVEIDDREINITSSNLYVNIYSFSISTYEIPNGIILMDGSTTALFNASIENLQSNCNLDVGIILPASLITENSNASDRLIFSVTKDFPHVTDTKVLSFIVSATVPNVSIYEFPKDEVVLFFKLIEKIENNQPPKCVFWDDSISSWSYKGCYSQEEKENFVVCVCNHLSRFAVIVGMHKTISGPHQTALHFITNIGGSLSCFGFGLIIATFGLFRSWRKYLKNKTLFNYSISQFIFLIIFMTCINQSNSKTFCKIVAILLHYFLIASFAWMIALAYTVYLSLVKVLGTYIPCLIQKFIVFAWGVPAVIVIIVLSVNPDFYSRDDYCWLSQDAIAYGILIPLGTMLTINYIVFGAIVFLNTCKASTLRLNQERRKLVVTRTKALFCTSVLLGLPWIFGFIGHFNKAGLEFQYLFSITTPIQGFLLAISFVIRPKSTRDLWLKLISPSSLSSSPSQTDSSYSTNKKLKPRISKYENVINSVVYRAHSPFTPYL